MRYPENTWKLILLYNPWIKQEIRRETLKYFSLSDAESTSTCQNLWDATKVCLEGNLQL